jgi:uncharacterized membrane protein
VRVPELRGSLAVALLGAAAGLALATPTVPTPLRALAAGALAFVLPGLALSLALLSRAGLMRSERIAVTVGSSLSSAIVAAFVLHFLPMGLTAGTWATLLGALTIICGLVGWLRADRQPGPVALVPTVDPAPVGARPAVVRPALVSLTSLATLAAAGVLAALALTLARGGVALGPTTAFTELWMLPQEGGAAVRVGVANHEGRAETYRLEVTVDGRPLGGSNMIPLANGGATDQLVVLPKGAKGARTVEARLWLADRPATEPPDRLVRAVVERAAPGTP